VLTSIGVRTRWLPDSNDLEIIPPAALDLDSIDVDAARRTRTVIMFLGPLLHETRVPTAVCRWLRPRHPHRRAASVGAAAFGLDVEATHGFYEAGRRRRCHPSRSSSPSVATR
jgi:UDP-N-acetylglucosamine 1-carboxyvinyltransferase